MSAAGQRLGLRLFLEGLEVPVVAAQVQININAPATASIQVVPGDKVLELRARTMVHLFFWDYTQDQDPETGPADAQLVADVYGVTIDEAREIIAADPERFGSTFDLDIKGYRLLFSGEVIGLVMSKTPLGRQAVLQCSDFSTYWDTTYQFFVSYSPNGNFLGTSAAVWAGGSSMFDDLTAGHVSVMNEYLRSKPKTKGLENVKGLMGGIISLLEAMGGVPRHTHGVNDFFTIAELKNHILQQITAEQNDDTAQRLFDSKAFMNWLTRGMSSMGQLVTFRDMMKLLFKYVYYEVVPNPAAMYVPRKKSSTTKTSKKTRTEENISPSATAKIGELITKAATYSSWNYLSTDPRLKAPSDEDRLAREFSKELKALLDPKDLPQKTKSKLEQADIQTTRIKSVSQSSTTVSNFANRQSPITVPKETPKQFLINREAWRRIDQLLHEALLGARVFEGVKHIIKRSDPELDRLQTQIFRPDCFFAAPPRCNVLFPDQYTQFQFSRNFLQETTRLRLSVSWLFGADSGGLLAEYHFAPSTKQIRALAKLQDNKGIRSLLPWEIYSGILPKFETIHEINYVAGKSERRLGLKGKFRGPVTAYAQRTANFNYVKYRFASRTCEVSAKFNPFMVCGFPALILERPFILDPDRVSLIRESLASQNSGADDMSEFVRTAARQFGAPTQYLGMVAALSHSVSQEGGGTTVVLTHARTHRVTDDDFLKLVSEEVTNDLTSEVSSVILDADDLLRKGDWRLLRLLRNATPQDLDKQAALLSKQQSTIDASSDDGADLEERPGTTPDLSALTRFGGFGSLLQTPSVEDNVGASLSNTTEVNGSLMIPIRGKTLKQRSKHGRRMILVPDPGGVLKIGDKGPKGGKIIQIECVSDQALAVVGKDVSKKLNSKKNVTIGSSVVDEFELDPATGKVLLRGNAVNNKNVSYFWKKIVIYESLSKHKVKKLLPVEESIRPPWFSPLYSNWFIGSQIYEKFFGCGSIVDQALFVAPGSGAVAVNTGRAKQQEVLDKLKDAGNDKSAMQGVVDKASADSISDVPDIESSVDTLAYIYGEVTRLGLDVHKFVQEYTNRPIATLEEILGSADLRYNTSGNKLVLASGEPGFHSTAIANVGDLIGLLDNPDTALPRLKSGKGKKEPLSRLLDPRPGRRAKVVEYLQEINASSGSLGVGVAG
jgi:hypothetical protein